MGLLIWQQYLSVLMNQGRKIVAKNSASCSLDMVSQDFRRFPHLNSCRWFMKCQHINPEDAVLVHQEVKAKKSLGIHWGTFNLSYEVRILNVFRYCWLVRGSLFVADFGSYTFYAICNFETNLILHFSFIWIHLRRLRRQCKKKD